MAKNIKKNDAKIPFIKSMAAKIMSVVMVAVLLTVLFEIWVFLPRFKEKLTNTAQNYMYDVAVAYGTSMANMVTAQGAATALKPANVIKLFDGVSVKCADNSYIYITDAQGIMLYHPDASKVGRPVENEVVKGLVAELAEERIPEPGVISYEYKGALKYAGYYINKTGNFILVVSADEAEVLKDVHLVTVAAVVAGILCFLVFATLAVIMAFVLTKPIRVLTANVLELAQLDLTEAATEKKTGARSDEIGAMSRALTKFRTVLAQTVLDIKGQSGTLSDAADYLNTGAAETTDAVSQVERAVTEIADGATSQAQETQKATENVITIGTMVEETTEEVALLTENANAMQAAGEKALETLHHLEETNSKTREAIDRIYEQTHTTNESAVKIREAATVITSIADETNLLSLNASIEAARAGEQGRGFAVVAAQIQKLAEQSNESARQIEAIIDSLIHDSRETVATMDIVKEIIAEQNANVEETGAGFETVKAGIDTSIESVERISGIIGRLDTARVNVVDVVQSLTAIAEENAASTEETSASVTEVAATIQTIAEQANALREVSADLDERVSVFKI